MNEKNIVKASLFTLILAFMVSGMFAIAAVMNKEKPVEIKKKTPLTTTWYYQGGNTNAEILDVNNWVSQPDGGQPHTDCDPDAEDLPCSIPGSEDPTDFESELASLGVTGIMDLSPQKRPFETP